jgi:hypothetical protein
MLGVGANSQGQILMPRHLPICFRRLVEVDSANWMRLEREMWANNVEQRRRASQSRNRRRCQKTALPSTGHGVKHGNQVALHYGAKNARDDRKSILLDFVAHRRTPVRLAKSGVA